MKKVWKGFAAAVSAAAIAATGFIGATSANAATGVAMTDTAAITIDGSQAGTTNAQGQVVGADKFTGYRLLNLESELLDENAHANDVFVYLVNETYRANLKTAIDAVNGDAAGEPANDAAIISYLKTNLTTNNINQFARAFMATNPASPAFENMTAANLKDNTNKVQVGYYLIAQTTIGDDSKYTESMYMVDTVSTQGATFNLKNGEVTLTKTVKDINDSTDSNEGAWGESADHDINDDVHFQLIGTLPDKYAEYTKYKYTFTDTASAGLTIKTDTIKVYAATSESEADNATTRVDITTQANIKVDGQTFTVAFADLKAVKNNQTSFITKDMAIVVEYTATLNANAIIGNNSADDTTTFPNQHGNPNKAKLEFSNNPNDGGEGTSETPWDYAVVFTFDLKVDKVDADKVALKGAGFTLYKYDVDATTPTDKWVAVGDEVKGTDMTTFTWTGLDDGKYKIVETTVPSGYNKADDVIFEIVTTHATKDGVEQVTGITIKDAEGTEISTGQNASFTTTLTPTTNSNSIATTIVNNKGSQLPSTGGMGTTILYVAGAAIVLIAGIGLAVALRRRQA